MEIAGYILIALNSAVMAYYYLSRKSGDTENVGILLIAISNAFVAVMLLLSKKFKSIKRG